MRNSNYPNFFKKIWKEELCINCEKKKVRYPILSKTPLFCAECYALGLKNNCGWLKIKLIKFFPDYFALKHDIKVLKRLNKDKESLSNEKSDYV